jgi:integrase
MISEGQKTESQGFLDDAAAGGSASPSPTNHAVDGPKIVRKEPSALVRSANAYANEARSKRTREEYAKQLAGFSAWCAEQGLCPLPAAPQTVALYLAARADEGRKVSTIALALAAISQAHQVAGYPTPRSDRLVKETWKGVRRRLGIAPDQKSPVSAKDIRRMVDALPAGILGLRDRALVTLGFAGGFRRSELVALDAADLTFVSEGLEAIVRRSKTDQEGAGLTKVVAYGSDPATCPVRALQDWLELAAIGEGPVFRPVNRHEQLSSQRLTGHAVAAIIKRVAKRAGMPTPELSGHSLRAGFVTEAKKNGADDAAIMDQTGHKSLAMVHRYHRRLLPKLLRPAHERRGPALGRASVTRGPDSPMGVQPALAAAHRLGLRP